MPLPRSRKLVVLILVLLLVAALGWWFSTRAQTQATAASEPAPAASAATSSTPSPGSSAPSALSVNLVSAREDEWPVVIEANGSIAAWQEAVIGAETQGLRLTDVRVQVGDRVRRGDVLALVRSDTTGAEVAVTRANIAEASASLAQARANADRARRLKESGALSAQQIHEFTTAEQTAQARLTALRARLKADELRLAQTRITAPDDGLISARVATVGQVVSPGEELFRLIRRGRLEWRAEVPSADLARLKPGLSVSVVPPGGAAVVGTLRQIAPTVDPTTRNGLVYVDLSQPGDARAGMFARGAFKLDASRSLTLPQSAVVLREGFSYAFAVDEQGRVTQRKLELGRRQGDRVQVLDGLQPGDRLVAQGGGFLADGDLVRVVGSAPEPKAVP